MADQRIKSFLDIDLSKSKAVIARASAARQTEEKKAVSLQTRVRQITARLAETEARARVLQGQLASQFKQVAQSLTILGLTEIVSNVSSELPSVVGSLISIGTTAAFAFAAGLGPIGAVVGALSATVLTIVNSIRQTNQRIEAITQNLKRLEDRGKAFEERFIKEFEQQVKARDEFLEDLRKQTDEKAKELVYESWQMLP